MLLSLSSLSDKEKEKRRIDSTYHELTKEDSLFLEQQIDNNIREISSEALFSRNSMRSMYLDKKLGHGVIRDPKKTKKISKDAILYSQFFKEIWDLPITTWIEKGRIDKDYHESIVNGIKCIVAEYSYYSKVTDKTSLLLRFWLDPGKAFSPVGMVHFRYDGTIFEQYDISEHINVDGVWLPVKGIRYNYIMGADLKNVLGNTLTLEVDTSSIRINSNIPDEKFELHFPPGTQVWDGIANIRYVVGEGTIDSK